MTSELAEAERKKRNQPSVMTLVVSAGILFVAAGCAVDLGRFGLGALVVLVSALFRLRDLRPNGCASCRARGSMPPE